MADRVRDAEDVDHRDRGYKYPLGHVLNDWDERRAAGPAMFGSQPVQARYSTPEHPVARVAAARPSVP
jgi:hypothetical protein